MFSQTHHLRLTTYEAGMLQSRAYRAVMGFMTEALEPHNLSVPGWAMLGALRDHQELRLNALAAVLGVKPPVATTLARDLCDRGLIERRPYDKDGRVTLMGLTPAGLDIVNSMETSMQDGLRSYLGDIPLDELAVYMRVLRKLAAKL